MPLGVSKALCCKASATPRNDDAHFSGTGALGVSKGQRPLSQSGIYFHCEVKNVSKMFPSFFKLPLHFLKFKEKK